LQIRLGIASGLVVVGDIMRSGNAIERGIVGETPNLAARIQGIANPNAVVIAESTRAWAALLRSSVESRFEAFHSSVRPRARTRTFAAALVESENRPRPSGVTIWRT
jgi:class 3 adenylate cyclase